MSKSSAMGLAAMLGAQNPLGFALLGDVASNLLDAQITFNENPGWNDLAANPYDAYRSSAVVINDKAYVFGGNTSPYTQTRVYDPVSDTWTNLAANPYNALGSSAVVINDKAYVFGGNTSPTATRVYDPVSYVAPYNGYLASEKHQLIRVNKNDIYMGESKTIVMIKEVPHV